MPKETIKGRDICMKSSINGMAEEFRSQLDKPGAVELPGCYDVLSAMILEEAGFNAVFLSGYGVAASMLGNPDIGLTSLAETTAAAKSVVNALKIPIVVDIDNGYGNEDNVLRVIHELEYSGVAAVIMEDQIMPKRCGHSGNKQVIPIEQYMAKLECALKSRQTPMTVIARTDSMDLSEAISRAKMFHAAGADVTLIDGLSSRDAIKRVADEVPGHKQINLIYGGKTPLLSVKELAELGFKVVLYSTPALYAAAQTLLESMRRLRESHDINSISSESIPFKNFQEFIERKYAERNARKLERSNHKSTAIPSSAAIR